MTPVLRFALELQQAHEVATMLRSKDTTASDQTASKEARRKLRKAERGNPSGTEELSQAGSSGGGAIVSAEQEASDGPEGRGLAR